MIQLLWDDFLRVLFPNNCVICNKRLTKDNANFCVYCQHHLPLTNYSFVPENDLEKMFYGRIPISAATAYLDFHKKGVAQKIIHHLKYRGNQQLGTYFGKLLASEMKQSERFEKIDIIVPVPLHSKKLKKRGYHQLRLFGKTLAKQLEVPYEEDFLIKKTHSNTQTLKKRFERWENIVNSFEIKNPNNRHPKHILLIDDVVTTGATIEACTNTLLKEKNLKISLATIAFTSSNSF